MTWLHFYDVVTHLFSPHGKPQPVGLLCLGIGSHTIESVTRVKVRYPCDWEESGRTAQLTDLVKAGENRPHKD